MHYGYTAGRAFMLGTMLLSCAALSLPSGARAQSSGSQQLPDVEVIQQQKQPQTTQAKPKPKKKPVQQAAPQPAPEPAVSPEPVQAAPADATAGEPYDGASGGQAAAARAANSSTNPINPSQGLLPGDLDGYAGAGNRITDADRDLTHPQSVNDALRSVPGVNIVNDDGYGRHGGIGMRGSPPRRGRKVLILEDGFPINMATYIDPSVHHVPPLDRIENIEVLRGPVFAYGPLTNHGVVNFQNLSPFGPNETEIGATIGYTEDGKEGYSTTRHVHTRQSLGNFGAVFSYSGAEVDGAWDLERLRFNDFYGALGWKSINQELVASVAYTRQRDDYDESNLEGEEGDAPGAVEAEFFNEIGHCKSCYNPGSRHNSYNADVLRLQLAHTYYWDDFTTTTSRVYGSYHRRDRYQNFEGEDPAEEDLGPAAVALDDEIIIPEGVMLGRLRTYKFVGADTRTEFANLAFAGGMTQDIQVGAKYEHQTFTNRNFFGRQGQILNDGDTTGTNAFSTQTEADAFAAFLQSTIHVTNDLHVTPGVRLEHYRVSRNKDIFSEEEGEGEEDTCANLGQPQLGDECVEIDIERDGGRDSFEKTHVLPGVALAYEGFFKSTIYGGYHRGLTTGVLREAAFPPGDELGNNFQLGLRSKAIRGITYDIAGFHHRIEDFQVKGSATNAVGNNIYSNIDEVHISGVELIVRAESQPWTGGPWNAFFEGGYTYSDSEIAKGISEDGDNLAGNDVPEVSSQIAHLTFGIAHEWGWDASLTWTYRGAFFTDEENTAFGGDPEGEDGEVPDVWLLSARANLKIPNTQASVFVAGENLTNELYITDREDGIKPGIGRTVLGGFKYKF